MPDSSVVYEVIPEMSGYRFGDDGSVWSCLVNSGRTTSEWRRLTPQLRPGRSRLSIGVLVFGKLTSFQVHHLILMAFVGPCPLGHETKFLDGDPRNVRLANLCWAPRSEVRFWSRLERSPGGCWVWPGATKVEGYGYGNIKFNNVYYGTHRLAYILAVGPVPAGLFVLHSCDNPPCCRPDHLFLGTNYDNVQDMVRKGRQARGPAAREHVNVGEQVGSSKLHEPDIVAIRRKFAAGGITMKELGDEYRVNATNIFHIVHRRTWKHVI
jgi:hypothetical protein